MGILAIDLDLGEHRKGHAVIARTKGRDLRLVAGLLMSELITGKAKHHEAAILIRGKASQAQRTAA